MRVFNDQKRRTAPAIWFGVITLGVIRMVAVLLVVLTVAACVVENQSHVRMSDELTSLIYQYTYDEVFQASQETIKRLGMFVTGVDKDKGMIIGNGDPFSRGIARFTFAIHIETLNTKPETRVTINCKSSRNRHDDEGLFKEKLSSELQKVLVTYR